MMSYIHVAYVALAIAGGLCSAQNDALEIINGKPLYIHCNLTNTKGEGAKVEWIKDSEDDNILTTGAKYTAFDHNNTLLIIKADPDDAGTYDCRTTSAPAFTKKFLVSFFELPKMVAETIKEEGEDVELTCEANGKPLPTVQWLKGDQKVTEVKRNPSYWHQPNEHNIAKAILSFKNATKSDEGLYTCKVFSDMDVHNTTTLLKVVPIGQGPRSAGPCGVWCGVLIALAVLIFIAIVLCCIFWDKIKKFSM